MLMALPTKSSMSCFFARNGFEDILMQIRVEAGEAHELLNAQVRSGRREEEAKTPMAHRRDKPILAKLGAP
jgi:hypothetical protein